MSAKDQAKLATHAHNEHTAPFMRALMAAGGLYALRVLYVSGGYTRTFEGLFTNADAAARAASAADHRPLTTDKFGRKLTEPLYPLGVYVVPSPANPALAARLEVGKLVEVGKDEGLKDHEVARRRALLIDVDPAKGAIQPGDRGVKGISASAEEIDVARQMADAIADDLTGRGWPSPIRVFSGNGEHLIYNIDLPNDVASERLVHATIASLKAAFARPGAEVDEVTFNASRIWKVAGTTARKGLDCAERPHRRAELLDAPDGWHLHPVTEAQLMALIDEVAAPDALKHLERGAPKSAPRAAAPAQDTGLVSAAQATALDDRSWVKSCLDAIPASISRSKWLSVANAVRGLLGDTEGEALFVAWSSAYGGKEADDVKAFRSRKADSEDDACRTLWGLGREHGWTYKEWRAANGVEIAPAPAPKRARTKPPAPAPAAPPAHYDAPPARAMPRGDVRLAHPLAQLWARNMPPNIIDETTICVADGLFRQLALVALPVRVGHKLLACDPVTSLWREVEHGDIARILPSWLDRVGIGKLDKDGSYESMYKGRGGGSKGAYTELHARAADISKHQQQQGVQLVLQDRVLRVDMARRELVREELQPQHYATYGFELTEAEVDRGQAPRWKAYLDGLFPEAASPAQTVEYLKRWTALALFGATIGFQAPALIIKGQAGTGKSTLGKIIAALMPPGSTTSVPIQNWESEYSRAELVGKLLNLDLELAIDEPVGGLNYVKKIIFGEITDARPIYGDVCNFYPQAAHLFCGNGLPNMKKADPAVFKRFVQLTVTGRVARGASWENTRFAEELVEQERAGILRDLVCALERALHDLRTRAAGTVNGLPALAETEGANEAWRSRSDAVATFLTDEYEHDPGMSLRTSPSLQTVYNRFKHWATENGYHHVNRGTFQTLVSNFYPIQERAGQRFVVGASQRHAAGGFGADDDA